MSQKAKQLPPDSATILERSCGVFFARWDELLRLRHVVLASSNPDDIHDLRVASRRFRAVLELFYQFLPDEHRGELKKSVRKITQALGGLRNVDEARLFFQSHSSGMTEPADFFQILSSLRSVELKRTTRLLASFDHHLFDRAVRKMIAALNEKNISSRNRFSILAHLSEVSLRSYLPIHQSLSIALHPEHVAERHTLRIAIKKWRYFLEIVEDILNCDYSVILELLKEYQSLLGKMNDLKEFETMVAAIELPAGQRKVVIEILAAEKVDLLGQFTELVDKKPLVYTFLL